MLFPAGEAELYERGVLSLAAPLTVTAFQGDSFLALPPGPTATLFYSMPELICVSVGKRLSRHFSHYFIS